MRWLEVAGLAVLAVGLVGYAAALVLVWRFRRWMGRRGEGWPRILLNALLALLTLLAALYLGSLAMTLGLVPWRGARLALAFLPAIGLSAAPWAVVVAFWRWWRPPARRLLARWRGDDD